MQGHPARLPVDQQLHPARTALNLGDAHDRPHGVEVFYLHLIAILPLRYREDSSVARESGLDRLQGARSPR